MTRQIDSALAFLRAVNAFVLPDRASLHEDVVLVAAGRTGARAHYHGHHGIREWLGDPAERAIAEVQLHADDVRHGDDRVIVLGRITRRAPDALARFEDPFAVRFEFSGDRIRRIETYASHEDALRVAARDPLRDVP